MDKTIDLNAKELFGYDQIARLKERSADDAETSRVLSKVGEEQGDFNSRILSKAGSEEGNTARLLSKAGFEEPIPQ